MKRALVIFLYLLLSNILQARGEMGGLSFGTAKMIYEQDGKFVIKLPSGEKFDFSTIFLLPENKQMVAWKIFEKTLNLPKNEKSTKDPIGVAKKIIYKESKILKTGMDQTSGKKSHNKKYSKYIQTDEEIQIFLKEKILKQLKRQKQACRKGNALECFKLGKLYYVGVGAKRSVKNAKYYFKRTCSLGMGIGCFYLGSKFSKTKKERIKYYKTSCAKGYDAGCTEVGSMYLHGRGTKQNFKKAYQYLDKACKRNDADGCHLMAAIYSFGLGRQKNNSLTKKYLREEKSIRKYPWKYK